MSTSAQVRAAFKTYVFDSETVQAITTKAYAYDVMANVASFSEDALLHFNQKINFVTYTVSRIRETGEVRGSNTTVSRYRFIVKLNYYIAKDIGEEDQGYNQAVDNIETIDATIASALGKKWGDTVDFNRVVSMQEAELITLDDREIWRVGYQYEGIKQI